MLGIRAFAGPSLRIALAIAGAACATPKPPIAEPQAPAPFASLVIECPPVLLEKDSGETGVFTASYNLDLSLVRTGESGPIVGACDRRERPVHVAPGNARLEAHYEERVKQRSSVLETPVACELPTLGQEWVAGKTYVYRVTVTKRDARGKFNACNVTLGDAQPNVPLPLASPSASASASASPSP